MSDELCPNLPVLTHVAKAIRSQWSGHGLKQALRETLVVFCQHALRSTTSLFSILQDLGLPMSNLHGLAKCYSQHAGTIQRLKQMGVSIDIIPYPKQVGEFAAAAEHRVALLQKNIAGLLQRNKFRRIVVLDDGAVIRDAMAPLAAACSIPIVAVEQTTFGVRSGPTDGVAMISVASCAAKRVFETPEIGAICARKLQPYLRGITRVAVLGCGKVGMEVLRQLPRQARHLQLMSYDPNPTRRIEGVHALGAEEAVERAQLVVGCSGIDQSAHLRTANGHKAFASCSSSDVEFNGALRQYAGRWLMVAQEGAGTPDLVVEDGARRWRMIRSGFPVNFDNSMDSVPAREIQLTRALLLIGVTQALRLGDERTRMVMLDPWLQLEAVRSWHGEIGARMPRHVTVEWMRNESNGELSPGRGVDTSIDL
jgi:hypothetical protein